MEKIKSAIKFNKAFRGQGFESNLKLNKCNGVADYISGFVKNGEKTAYVNIDCQNLTLKSLQFMYRTAKNDKDYTGGTNQYAKNSDELIESVVSMLSL